MDDIRYSEFLFLRTIANAELQYVNDMTSARIKELNSRGMYLEMVLAALEDNHIRIDNSNLKYLVMRLRGEISERGTWSNMFQDWQWQNPRETMETILRNNNLQRASITYRGLQRIEDLRDLLKRDRILERFGVLLDIRYFRQDLEDALKRSAETAVSVLYGDMDNFKRINDGFGHDAGDVVMKSYLECVRDGLGQFGTGYRGVGDETVGLIVGQDTARAQQICEDIRKRVAALKCEHKGQKLPPVTASIGLATTPPADRSMELESLADQRQQKAKQGGKNRVVSS